MAKRVSKIDLQFRTDMLLRYKAEGYSYTHLVKAAMEWWSVSQRQAKRYMSEVTTLERCMANMSNDEFLGTYLNRANYQYIKATEAGNTALASKINDNTLKHLQLRQKQCREMNHEQDTGSGLPDRDEIARIMEEIRGQR